MEVRLEDVNLLSGLWWWWCCCTSSLFCCQRGDWVVTWFSHWLGYSVV